MSAPSSSFVKNTQQQLSSGSVAIGDDINTVSCKCLNVRFSLLSLAAGKIPLDDPEYSSDSLCGDDDGIISSLLMNEPKMLHTEAALQPNHGAIVTFIYLLSIKNTGKWKVFRCFNCKTLTHVSSLIKPDMVLVNIDAMLTQSQQDSIVADNPNYCKFYGVVCSPSLKNHRPTFSKSLKPSAMDLVRDVQDRAHNYLQDEKSKMRERILQYERTQLALFQDLEQSITDHRNSLEEVIGSMFAETVEDADSAFERSVEEISLDSSPNYTNGNYNICGNKC